MNCLDADLLLQRHFDGELTQAQSFSLARHLQRCLSCRMEFDKLRREMRDLIVDVAEPRFDPDAMRARIASSIAGLRPRHPLPLAPFSISLCLVIAAFLGWNLFRAPESGHGLPAQAPPAPGESRMFLPGAEIALEENAELCEGMPATLHSGAVTIKVPANAGPFLLETPSGTILCREGKFRVGVSVDDASSSVLVLEGEVGIDDASGSKKLHAGDAIFLKKEPR